MKVWLNIFIYVRRHNKRRTFPQYEHRWRGKPSFFSIMPNNWFHGLFSVNRCSKHPIYMKIVLSFWNFAGCRLGIHHSFSIPSKHLVTLFWTFWQGGIYNINGVNLSQMPILIAKTFYLPVKGGNFCHLEWEMFSC